MLKTIMNNPIFGITETKAKQKLRQALGKHFSCPKCSRKKYVKKLKGSDRRYFCMKCRYKFSLKLRAGFKHSNLDYQSLYLTLNAWGKNKTHNDSMDWTGLSYPSTRLQYERLRSNFKKALPTDKIFGEISCDESFIGKRKNDNQAILMGGVNQEFTDLRLEVIEDREQDSIEGFLHHHIEPGSLVKSDGHESYMAIEDVGYLHDFEIHANGEFEKTVPIERVWALFKTFLTRTYHHIHKEKLSEYAVEFQFKFLHQKFRRDPQYLAKILNSTVPNG